MNILIVDDGESARDLLRRILQKAGHHVLAACDGLEALALLRREPVAVILADIMMPQMDGYRLCQAVRLDERLRHVPFIIYTSNYGSPADEKMALDLGADAFLHKPATAAAILETLQRVTSQPRAQKPVPAMGRPESDVMQEYSDRLVAKLEQRNNDLAQLNETLRASEERYRLLADYAEDFVTLQDIEGHSLYISPSFYRVTNWTPDEIRNAPWRTFLHSDDLPFIRQARAANLAGELTTIEHRIHCRDGRWLWVEARRKPVCGPDGRVKQLLIWSRDITERKRAEHLLAWEMSALELSASSAPMAEILDELMLGIERQAPGAICSVLLLDADGVHLRHGSAPSLPTDYNCLIDGVVIGPSVGSCGTAAYANRQVFVANIASDPLWANYCKLACAHGLAACWSTPVHSSQGKILGTFAIYYRESRLPSPIELELIRRAKHLVGLVIERKRAEEEARLAQLAREELIAAVDGIVWEADAKTFKFTFVSAQAERLLGYPVARWLESPTFWADHIHPDDREQAVRYCVTCTAERRDHAFDYRMLAADGRVVWLHDVVTVLVENGRPAKLRGIMVDITERRHLEAQLRESQKIEAIGRLAGGIAHDFNNILAAILGNAELIQMGPPLSPANAECLSAITKASQRAADLVRQILTFSRQQENVRLPIQLETVVREAIKLMRATVPTTIEFQMNLARTRTVLADASQIHQVVMNLCANAAHAMKDRAGVLTVELAETEVDASFAQAHADLRPGHHVCLRVTDTGCGMDRAMLERIFEPFFTTKPPGEGTGLGLSVVHGIIKSHDGAITVHSQPGVGTTFHLYFPGVEVAVAQPMDGLRSLARGRGERILFVDDEVALTQLGDAVLNRLGYQVTVMSSVVDALTEFQRDPHRFDLVITDLNMPVMNGTTFARELLDIRPELKIILSTGYSSTLTPEGALALGFSALLPKPADLRSLSETVQRVLTGTSPA